MKTATIVNRLESVRVPALQDLRSALTTDLAIDPGAARTRIYVAGEGVALDEPSVLARHLRTGEIIAAGQLAHSMTGREPQMVRVIRPIKGSVVADFDAAVQMLRIFIGRAIKRWKPLRPRVLMAIPGGITAVERRAFIELAERAGARSVELIENHLAIAEAMKLSGQPARTRLIVNIGGETTSTTVFSQRGLIHTSTLRTGGSAIDQLLIRFFREHYKLELGEWLAEETKLKLGAAARRSGAEVIDVVGRKLTTRLPEMITVPAAEIEAAIAPVTGKITRHVQTVLEQLPAEVTADVFQAGITLTGGGSQLARLAELLSEELSVTTTLAPEPELAVVQGAGQLLEQAQSLLGLGEIALSHPEYGMGSQADSLADLPTPNARPNRRVEAGRGRLAFLTHRRHTLRLVPPVAVEESAAEEVFTHNHSGAEPVFNQRQSQRLSG